MTVCSRGVTEKMKQSTITTSTEFTTLSFTILTNFHMKNVLKFLGLLINFIEFFDFSLTLLRPGVGNRGGSDTAHFKNNPRCQLRRFAENANNFDQGCKLSAFRRNEILAA